MATTTTATFKLIKIHLILIYFYMPTISSGDTSFVFTSSAYQIRQGGIFNLTCTDPTGELVKFMRIETHNGDNMNASMINSTSIRSEIIQTHNLDEQIRYECLLIGENETKRAQIGLTVHVLHRLEVSNFDCFFPAEQKMNKNLSCEITLPYDAQTKYYDYHLRREFPFPDGNQPDCATNNSIVKCQLQELEILDGKDINVPLVFNFTFLMTDSMAESKMTFLKSREKIVKLPPAVIGSKVSFSDRICFEICGDNFNEVYGWQVEWNIEVKNESGKSIDFSPTNCTLPNKLFTVAEKHTCCLGELHPYRNYQVNVNRRFANSSIAHWSNETINSLRTLCDKPAEPPYMEANWFEYNSGTLRIYWIQLPEDRKNCANVSYMTELINNDGKRMTLNHIDANSATIKNWDTSGSYNISVWSINECGASLDRNLVRVPRLNDESQQQQLEVTYNRETVEVTWKFRDQKYNSTDLKGFTVFWCHPSRMTARCVETESIQYDKVDRNRVSYNFRNLKSSALITIAVLANYGNAASSGGLNWDVDTQMAQIRHWFYYLVTCILSLIFAITVVYFYREYRKMENIAADLHIELNTPLAQLMKKEGYTNQAKPTTNFLSFLIQLISKDELILPPSFAQMIATQEKTETETETGTETETKSEEKTPNRIQLFSIDEPPMKNEPVPEPEPEPAPDTKMLTDPFNYVAYESNYNFKYTSMSLEYFLSLFFLYQYWYRV